MKRYCAFLMFSFLLSCSERQAPYEPPPPGSGYTMIQGSVSGLLRLSQSPFRVTGDVLVDSLAILTIQPGVIIRFQDSTKLVVRGKLVCAGTLSAPILFTSYSERWKGIIISNSSEVSSFQFAIVESVDVSGDFDRNGAVEISNSIIIAANSIFRGNRAVNGGAISIDQSQSVISNCFFLDNYASTFAGAVLSSQSSNRIINNTFFKNSSFNYGGGLVLSSPVFDEVQNNIFYMNTNSLGDPRVAYYQTDSTHYVSQFNFLPFGSLDPKFVSLTDFHLAYGSPCIDSGNSGSQFNDADGTRNDQGAYGGPLGNW